MGLDVTGLQIGAQAGPVQLAIRNGHITSDAWLGVSITSINDSISITGYAGGSMIADLPILIPATDYVLPLRITINMAAFTPDRTSNAVQISCGADCDSIMLVLFPPVSGLDFLMRDPTPFVDGVDKILSMHSSRLPSQ